MSGFKFLRFLVLAAPLFLTACGEEWEMVRTDKMVPYGNTRTAGTGVAYVRAKMCPKKELNLAPAEAPAVKPDAVFKKAQTK